MDQTATRFAGDIPKYYDSVLVPVIFIDSAEDVAARVARFNPQRVLETAGGTGVATRALRDRLPAGAHLTMTDLNADMIEMARARFRPGEAVTMQPADALALPFADTSFEAMVCQFGVMFYPDPAKGYREAFRVLAPRGRYFFSIWDSHRHNPYARITHQLVGELLPEKPPQFMTVPFANRFEPIKETLGDVGFTDITARVLRWQKPVDVVQFARGVIYGTPLYNDLKARPGLDLEAMAAKLEERFRSEFGEPGTMPIQAILFEATKP
jgi:SAM-dependent methyltransferase